MIYRFRDTIFFCLIALFFIFALSRTRSAKSLRLAGSTAFLPFAENLVELYMEKHPDITIDVQGGGSAVGIMATLQGIVDIGMVDMTTLPKETDSLEKVIVARDGIAVIVHPSNKVEGLTLEQLRDIFNGKSKSWKDVGGATSPIRVISREEGSGTRKSFDQLVLNGVKLSSDAMFQDSNGSIREAVKNDPDSISYISIGFLTSPVKPLRIDGVTASNENVKAGKYKIARPIYFLLKNNPTRDTQEFVKFMLGSVAQGMIETDGLISIK